VRISRDCWLSFERPEALFHMNKSNKVPAYLYGIDQHLALDINVGLIPLPIALSKLTANSQKGKNGHIVGSRKLDATGVSLEYGGDRAL
jgi:hypothetical protein